MAKKNRLNEDFIQYYSHVLINKGKRAGFTFLCFFLFFLMTLVLTNHLLHEGRSWLLAMIPLVILGIPLLLYPSVEQWVYKPWQAKAQKLERHYRD